jgi:hypothetical protein
MVIYGKPGAHGKKVLKGIVKSLFFNSLSLFLLAFASLNLLIAKKKDILIITGLAVSIILVGIFILRVNKGYITFKRYESGVRAEVIVGEALMALKPKILAHGFTLDKIGDCDHIAITNKVYLIETKQGRGFIEVKNGAIYINGKIMPRDPIKQINSQEKMLKRALPLPVEKIICIINSKNTVKYGDILITNTEGLKTLPIKFEQSLSESQLESIKNIIKKSY